MKASRGAFMVPVLFAGWTVGDGGGAGTTLAALALPEPVAVAVHFQDMDVMRSGPEKSDSSISGFPRANAA